MNVRPARIAGALSGRAGLAGIRWLLLGAEPREVVQRELAALLPRAETLGACHLRYAKMSVKRNFKLSAYYDVEIPSRGTNGHVRAIALMWNPKRSSGATAADWATTEFAEMEAQAARVGIAAPFRKLTARVPAWGLSIQISPVDTTFPQLLRVCNPEHVRNMLANAYMSNRDAPRYTLASHYTVRWIKYQPGQRHLLRYDPAEAEAQTVFAKIYNDGQETGISRVTIKAADWLSARLERAACLRPLAYLPEDGVVLYPHLCGKPFPELLRRRERDAGGYLELAGRALSVLHSAPGRLIRTLRPRSFEREITVVEHKCDFLPILLPATGRVIQAVIGRAQELYARLPQEALTFIHGDCKPEHFWATPEGITVFDLDSACLADPAADVGRFLADLALWYEIWQHPGFSEAQARFLAGYAAQAPKERLIRARLFEALELARSTGRRLAQIDDHWERAVRRLVRHAVALLDDLERKPPATCQRPVRGA